MQIDKNKVYKINDYSFINFININDEMINQVWHWRNDPQIRNFMYNNKEFPIEQHRRFVKSLNKRNDIAYWIVRKGNEEVGVTSLTDINLQNSSAELGYYLLPSKLNSGLGLEFAYNNLLFVFGPQIQCKLLHGAIHRSNINALVLDSYLGCDIQMEDLKDSSKEFISFNITKEQFETVATKKNDIRLFISFVKTHRKDFQV